MIYPIHWIGHRNLLIGVDLVWKYGIDQKRAFPGELSFRNYSMGH